MKCIEFDMDGTIADLYGVNNWLEYLINEDTHPYDIAEPLCDMVKLRNLLLTAKTQGYKIGIISWLSKNGTREYNEKVTISKIKWLTRYGLYDIMDKVQIVSYGTNKNSLSHGSYKILVDDEEKNRLMWGGLAIDPTKNLLESLENLLTF